MPVNKWWNLSEDASVVIVTDSAQKSVADALARELANPCRVILFGESPNLMQELRALRPKDLVIALLSFDTYMQDGANDFFSPFSKPKGVAAKFTFIRLSISKESLFQGLSTPKEEVYGMIAELGAHKQGARLRVTNAAGTDITLEINGFETCSHEIRGDGEMAFLPPSETSAEVKPGAANGMIAVDVTVGQLYHYGELLGEFGLVTWPVTLTVENGVVTAIEGGEMARELKGKLFALPPECRELVELGHGLSRMSPTGLIGVDESIIDTCHFGIGDGGKCGLHLDVVISKPKITKC